MRCLIAAAIGLLALGACATAPGRISDIGAFGRADITLKSGKTLSLHGPREYGEAYCGAEFCVHKADVRGVRGHDDPGPATAIIGGTMQAIWCSDKRQVSVYCANPGPVEPPTGPLATERQKSRAWLDNLVIRDDRIIAGGRRNSCVNEAAQPIAQAFATDEEALGWIWMHAMAMTPMCLLDAAVVMADRDDHERARRLWALASVRMAWAQRHCRTDPLRPLASTAYRITPPALLEVGGRGDPATLDEINRTLDDELTFGATQADVALACHAGLAAQAPDRAAFVETARPFLDAPKS